MVRDIRTRLDRLHRLANEEKEVSVEEAVFLWIKLLNYSVLGYDVSEEALGNFKPPFGNVKREDYSNAMKEYERLKSIKETQGNA